jgi:hypothetical protein
MLRGPVALCRTKQVLHEITTGPWYIGPLLIY